MKYPNNLRQLRESSGVNINQLAEALGIGQNYAYKLEAGDRRITKTMIPQIAALFGINESDIKTDRELNDQGIDPDVHELAFNRFYELLGNGKLKKLPVDQYAKFTFELYKFGLQEKHLDDQAIISNASALRILKDFLTEVETHA